MTRIQPTRSASRTTVRWTIRLAAATVAGTGAWLVHLGVTTLWAVGRVLQPAGGGSTTNAGGTALAVFFGPAGLLSCIVGLGMLGLGWWMIGAPKPWRTRTAGW